MALNGTQRVDIPLSKEIKPNPESNYLSVYKALTKKIQQINKIKNS